MTATLTTVRNIDEQIRHVKRTWFAAYASATTVGLLIALFARRRLTEPFLGLSLGLFMLVVVGWLVRPRATFYVTVFLTAISDIVTVSWFPFVKNFSSQESIAYVADAVTISPLELSLGVGFVITALRQYADTGRLMAPSVLRTPVVVFSIFVAFGFLRGVIIGGGDLRIAVLEGRALFYLLLVYGIAVNVCTEDRHFRYAFWSLLSGVFIQVLLSVEFLGRLDPAARSTLESLNEHGSGLGHNLLLLTLLALVVLRAKAPIARVALVVALVPTVYVYLAAQRRSAIAGLMVAVVMLLVALFWRRRRLFWVVGPLTIALSLAYLAVFWNSQASIAFPVQAVKSSISPESASAADRSSDLYRMIESYNLIFTIRSDPFKGIGFGRPFYRPIPLPWLANFELQDYLPHNSMLWLWLKVGFGGFVAMFYLVAKALLCGADRLRRTTLGVDAIVVLMATSFITMFVVYSFVDISWDARNMVFFGLCCAICGRSPDTTRSRAPAIRLERSGAENLVVPDTAFR